MISVFQLLIVARVVCCVAVVLALSVFALPDLESFVNRWRYEDSEIDYVPFAMNAELALLSMNFTLRLRLSMLVVICHHTLTGFPSGRCFGLRFRSLRILRLVRNPPRVPHHVAQRHQVRGGGRGTERRRQDSLDPSGMMFIHIWHSKELQGWPKRWAPGCVKMR